MDFLNGINRALAFINNNWTAILVFIGLIIGLYKKIESYIGKSTEEKVNIAKVQIREAMLKMITDAEVDFEQWNGAGSIKRSQVIQKIFSEYPILSKIADQESLISWIDDEINSALKTLRVIVADNKDKA